jgi:hypothetical protein
MGSLSYPAFVYEFRNLKLESIINDLHKLTPEELRKIKQELDQILLMALEKERHV